MTGSLVIQYSSLETKVATSCNNARSGIASNELLAALCMANAWDECPSCPIYGLFIRSYLFPVKFNIEWLPGTLFLSFLLWTKPRRPHTQFECHFCACLMKCRREQGQGGQKRKRAGDVSSVEAVESLRLP